jgi:excisionase family DNA binding protein
MIDEQQWITVPQAASLLDLRKRTVKRWIRAGRLQGQRDINGNLGVSLKDVENLRRDLFTESEADLEPDDANEPQFRGDWDFADAPADENPAVEHLEKIIDEKPDVVGSYVEDTQDSPSPEPETASAQHTAQGATRDPLEALEHQAERSIQVAGAAFHEAKEMAIAYREELQSARKDHREELHRVRRNGHIAWGLVAAAVLVILGGAWFIGQQFGDQKLHESRVWHLSEKLGETATVNQKLQASIDALKTESVGVAKELRTARLGQADAVGQLAAYRAHAQELSHRAKVLETQIRQERTAHKSALKQAKQQAVLLERKRLALIRQEQAERAERERQKIAAQDRAQRQAVQLRQEEQIRAEQDRIARKRRAQAEAQARTEQEQQRIAAPPTRDESLAQLDQRTRMFRRRNAAENLTLTELENALTPKK